MPEVQVTHDDAGHRFTAELDGELAMAEYHLQGGEAHFTHTEVPPAFEGRGVGSRLAKAALDWAVAEGHRIVPQCPFIAAYVKRHREYHEHVPGEWRRLVER